MNLNNNSLNSLNFNKTSNKVTNRHLYINFQANLIFKKSILDEFKKEEE